MVTDRFQDEVKEYLKPFEGHFNYRNLLHGHIDNTRYYAFVEEIAEHSAIAGATVLSSGCGSGGDLQVFLEVGAALAHGIEISAELAHLARQRFQGTQFEHRVLVDVYDGSNLPYCDNCFDVVFSVHVIEHTQDPRLYLIELFRVLKPRGVIFLELPNRYYWREQHTLLPFIHYPPVKQRDALIKRLVSEPLVRLWSEQTVYKLRTLVGIRTPMPTEVLQQIWAHRADFGLELKDAYFCAPAFGNIPYERLSLKNLNHYVRFMTTFRVFVGKDGTGHG